MANFARAIGRSSAQVSQWVNASLNSGTGKPRGMSSDSCRHIEKMVGRPKGWMDERHGDITPAPGALGFAYSSNMRHSLETVAHALQRADDLTLDQVKPLMARLLDTPERAPEIVPRIAALLTGDAPH